MLLFCSLRLCTGGFHGVPLSDYPLGLPDWLSELLQQTEDLLCETDRPFHSITVIGSG